MKTIIAALALDGGDDPVAARAMQLAAQHDAALILIHVIEDMDTGEAGLPSGMDAAAVRNMLERHAANRVDAIVTRMAPENRPACIIRAGRPFEAIMDLAEQEKADLVVIGPGKAKTLRERAFGSTADRIVRAAPVPVLVVRLAHAAPYRRAIVAADLSPQSLSASRALRSLAPEAAIDHVHVVEMPPSFEQALLQAGVSKAEIDGHRRVRAMAARDRLKAAFVSDGDGAPLKLRLVHGDARAVMARQARRRDIDLIALGTHGRGIVSQMLLGSVARHVLQRASCDVLLVPR
jgi:nucleotide-binding universal stress UspA family protein